MADEVDLKLIVGLGNPGEKYEGTRHNAGFMVLDRLAEEENLTWQLESKWESVMTKLGGVALVKPQTYMNESGRAVGSLMRFYRWQPEQVLIVYDDVALPLGDLRFKMKGGHAGHNGLRSLIDHLNGQDFPRLKFGIGAASGEQLVGHVLGRFAMAERETLENTLATAKKAVQRAASRGVAAAANEFNVRSQPAPAADPTSSEVPSDPKSSSTEPETPPSS